MSRLIPKKDHRISYDEKTGVVRSFFGAELVRPLPAAKQGLTAEGKSDDFLEANRDLFKLEGITLQKAGVLEGAGSQSMPYEQQHANIPVYGAKLTIGQSKRDGNITSAINTLDYELPPTLGLDQVTVSADQALELMHKRFDSQFGSLKLGKPTLYVYRHVIEEGPELRSAHPIRKMMLGLGIGKANEVYLVWQIMMDSRDPSGYWELLVDATNGELVAVHDRSSYATLKGYVFWPDPIRSKQDDSLTWGTTDSILDAERVEVNLDNLDAPINNKYKLNGSWVENTDWDTPTFAPPEAKSDFKYGAKTKEFLSVMAYYYLDRLVTYLNGLGVTAYNSAATKRIKVDAQGLSGADNSSSYTDSNGITWIRLGGDTAQGAAGGLPHATDPGIIVHEYGHAVYRLLGVASTNSYEYEQGWCDFLAACWLDRFNDHQFQREEVFPWKQHAYGTAHDWPGRRMDLTQRFDDAGFSSYGHDFKGDIFASALWDWFLNIGGNSADPNERERAADEVIRTYMDMIVLTGVNTPPLTLANGLVTADANRTGGAYKRAIWDAFRRCGLWSLNCTVPSWLSTLLLEEETAKGSALPSLTLLL